MLTPHGKLNAPAAASAAASSASFIPPPTRSLPPSKAAFAGCDGYSVYKRLRLNSSQPHLIYFLRVPKTASVSLLTTMALCTGCYDTGGALAQFDDVRIACERRDAIYGKGSNTLEVDSSTSSKSKVGRVCSVTSSPQLPALRYHGAVQAGSYWGSEGDDRSTCDAMRRMTRPGIFALHRAFIDLPRACEWTRPAVLTLTMMRQPLSRVHSSYDYFFANCVCPTKPLFWCWRYTEIVAASRAFRHCPASLPRPPLSFSRAVVLLASGSDGDGDPLKAMGLVVLRTALGEGYQHFYGHRLGGAGSQYNETLTTQSSESLEQPLHSPQHKVAAATLSSCILWAGILEDYALSIGVLKLLLPQYFGGLDADLVTTVEANSAKKLYKEDSHLKRGARLSSKSHSAEKRGARRGVWSGNHSALQDGPSATRAAEGSRGPSTAGSRGLSTAGSRGLKEATSTLVATLLEPYLAVENALYALGVAKLSRQAAALRLSR